MKVKIMNSRNKWEVYEFADSRDPDLDVLLEHAINDTLVILDKPRKEFSFTATVGNREYTITFHGKDKETEIGLWDDFRSLYRGYLTTEDYDTYKQRLQEEVNKTYTIT